MTKNRVVNWAMNNGALVGLIALCIALFIATPYFLTVANLLNIGIQAATVAILAFGMTFVIVTAGIDLSVGSVAALGAMVSAYMFSTAGLPGWLTLLIGLIVGALAGAICGMATAWGKIPSFIATLAMMSIARGLTLVISQGSPIETAPSVNAFGGDIAGFPVPIIMMVIAGLICWFILERTVLGRSMYAIGGNLEAARLSGISVERTKLAVFAINGLMVAIAGLILSSRLGAGSPSAGNIAELDAIAACVIGGTSLAGGVGSVAGAVMGAFIMSALDNGMSMMDVATFWQYIVKGVILLLAVWMDSATKRRS